MANNQVTGRDERAPEASGTYDQSWGTSQQHQQQQQQRTHTSLLTKVAGDNCDSGESVMLRASLPRVASRALRLGARGASRMDAACALGLGESESVELRCVKAGSDALCLSTAAWAMRSPVPRFTERVLCARRAVLLACASGTAQQARECAAGWDPHAAQRAV